MLDNTSVRILYLDITVGSVISEPTILYTCTLQFPVERNVCIRRGQAWLTCMGTNMNTSLFPVERNVCIRSGQARFFLLPTSITLTNNTHLWPYFPSLPLEHLMLSLATYYLLSATVYT